MSILKSTESKRILDEFITELNSFYNIILHVINTVEPQNKGHIGTSTCCTLTKKIIYPTAEAEPGCRVMVVSMTAHLINQFCWVWF